MKPDDVDGNTTEEHECINSDEQDERSIQHNSTVNRELSSLLKPARDALKTHLLALKQRLDQDIREAKRSVEMERNVWVNLTKEVSHQKSTYDNIISQLEDKKKEEIDIQNRYKAAKEDIDLLVKRLQQEEASTSRKKRRVASLDLQLRQATDMLNHARLANEKQLKELSIKKRDAYVAQGHAQQSQNSFNAHQALVEVLQNQCNTLQAQTKIHIAAAEEHRCTADEIKEQINLVNSAIDSSKTESVSLEKKWSCALNTLRLKDAALDVAHQQHEDCRNQQKACHTELRVIEKQINEAFQNNFRCCHRVALFLQHKQVVQASIDALHVEKRQAEEAQRKVQNELVAAEAQAALVEKEANTAEQDANELTRHRRKVEQHCQSLQKELITRLDAHSSTEMDIKALMKELRSAESETERIHTLLESYKDKLMKMEVKINAQHGTAQLIEKDLAEADLLIVQRQYQLQMNQDEANSMIKDIEKHSRALDSVNKNLQKMIEKTGQVEDAAPLENEISNLQKEIDHTQTKIQSIDSSWTALKQQFFASFQHAKSLTATENSINSAVVDVCTKLQDIACKEAAAEKSIDLLKKQLKSLSFQSSKQDSQMDDISIKKSKEISSFALLLVKSQEELDAVHSAVAIKAENVQQILEASTQILSSIDKTKESLSHSLSTLDRLKQQGILATQSSSHTCSTITELQKTFFSLQRELMEIQRKRDKASMQLIKAVDTTGVLVSRK